MSLAAADLRGRPEEKPETGPGALTARVCAVGCWLSTSTEQWVQCGGVHVA